jgi:DNA polymerase-3 subunit alpha
MTDTLKKWVEENKLVVSASSIGGADIITLDGVGDFLYIHPFDGNIIDEDFGFILSDEEFEILDEKKVNYILFEFGTKFYYSGLKQDRNKYNEIIYKPEFLDFKYIGKCSEEYIMDFVHLGIHDEYEMMNGSGACDLWGTKAKFLGFKAIGVCNKNVLASTLSFKATCDEKGMKAIIGETVTVARNYNKDNDIQETFDLKLYVNTDEGWENLLYISKRINVDYSGFIPNEELLTRGKGLTAVIPKESEFNYLIDKGNDKEARILLKKYKNAFDKVYYQIDTVEYTSKTLFKEHLNHIDRYIKDFHKKVQPILINDSYYLDKEEHELKGLLNKINGKVNPEAENQYFKSTQETLEAYEEWFDEVEPLFEVIVEGMQNTVVLADNVTFNLDTSERKIPKFEVDDPEALFFDLLEKGIQKKLVGKVKNIDEYMKRIEVECNLIVPNDLASYFLILWDVINWCKTQNIMVGPGRGSVCGSLVAYCLDITQIDPIPYALYFERFLNASRVSAHHAYHLTMEDGSELEFHDGDNIPLVGGGEIYASKEVDWNKIDIDVKRIIR